MGKSQIEWCDQVWQPVVGCTKVSPGCENCYALKNAWRFSHHPNPKVSSLYQGTATMRSGHLVWTNQVNTFPALLSEPAKLKKPSRIFVVSQGDLWHEAVPDDFIDQVIATAIDSPRHRFLFLTKRPARLAQHLQTFRQKWLWHYNGEPPLDHCWFGTSAERQQEADTRIPQLFGAPARHFWVSAEPLLGPLNLTRYLDHPSFLGDAEPRLEWVVAGCESGPRDKIRPDDEGWYYSLIEQSGYFQTPLFIKQRQHADGSVVKMPEFYDPGDPNRRLRTFAEYPPELRLPGDGQEG